MRVNLEQSRLHDVQFRSGRIGTVRQVLTGAYVVPEGSPFAHYLDPNGSDREVRLPQTVKDKAQIIGHVGTANLLNVYDSLGTFVVTLQRREIAFCIATASEWLALRSLAFSASDTDPVVVEASDTLVVDPDVRRYIFNRTVAPAAMDVQLPDVSEGYDIVFLDWAKNTGTYPITFLPAAGQTIMGESSWIMATDYDNARATFSPSPTLNGWYVH